MADNYMEIAKFRDEGLLQEVNRQFFHPLGLAMSINMGITSDAELEELLQQHGIQFGLDARGCVSTFIHLMGLDKPFLAGIIEDDDPEGWNFAFNSSEEVEASLSKVQKVKERFNRFAANRMKALGYVVQPPESFQVRDQS